MYIYLLLYILLIVPLLNYKVDKKIIILSSLIFIFLINFLRDPSASTDFHNYIGAIEGEKLYLKNYDPTFGFIIDLLKDVFGFNSYITYQIICFIPFACIFLSAFILNSYLIIPIYLSSETFVLLSFNAIRQGLAIGFLTLASAVFIKEIIESKKNKTAPYIKVIGISFISFLVHKSSIIIFIFFLINIVINRFIKILLSQRINVKTILFFIFGLLFFLLFSFFQGNILNSLFLKILSVQDLLNVNNLLQTGLGYGKSHLNSIYRFTIMYLIYFYVLINLKKFGLSEEKNKDLKYFLSSINFSFIPLIIILIFLPGFILSRFSHYYLIPIFGMFYFLNKHLDSRNTILCKIITVIGLITYSSNSVISNLFSIPN